MKLTTCAMTVERYFRIKVSAKRYKQKSVSAQALYELVKLYSIPFCKTPPDVSRVESNSVKNSTNQTELLLTLSLNSCL